MKKDSQVTRRTFMQTTGAAAATLSMAGLSSKAFSQSKNDTLGIAVIGTGGRGNSHLGMIKRLIDAGEI